MSWGRFTAIKHACFIAMKRRLSADGEAILEVALDRVEADPLLAHRVPLAHGHRVVLEGVEVDGEAERRADLVLTPVPPADRPGVVEVDVPAHAQRRGQITGLRGEVGVA